MRKFYPFFNLLILVLICGCKKDDQSLPCDGNGIITFNNKTDSTVRVQILEAHNTFTLKKDYIKDITVKGNISYTISIEGRNINLDTTYGIHSCESRDFTILH